MGETGQWRIWGSLSLALSWARELTRHCWNHDAFQGMGPSLRENMFQGTQPFTKRQDPSLGLPPASPGSFASQGWSWCTRALLYLGLCSSTVLGSHLLNTNLLWSQLRNKPGVESATLGISCPFQCCWRYWQGIRADCGMENIQWHMITCKAPCGREEAKKESSEITLCNDSYPARLLKVRGYILAAQLLPDLEIHLMVFTKTSK